MAEVEDERSRIFVSAASAYEIAYKNRLGKLREADILLTAFEERLAEQRFELLNVTVAHALAAGQLDPSHRDPFDRLLMAQAQLENAVLVSNEKLFDLFGVPRLW